MTLDPNVQVAILAFFGVVVTTFGVVMSAKINNQKERQKAAKAGVEAGLDERDVLERIIDLLEQIEKLKETILGLRREIRELKEENRRLRTKGS